MVQANQKSVSTPSVLQTTTANITIKSTLKSNLRHIVMGTGAAVALLAQGVNSRCAIYSPLKAPSGSSCLTSLNPEADLRMVCISTGAGPVVEESDSWSASSFSPRGHGFASATRDYNSNIAATFREGLNGQFQAPLARDRETLAALLETGNTFEFARCGDTAIYVFGDQNSTETSVNDRYRDVQAVVDLLQRGAANPTLCVCPLTHQEIDLSHSGSSKSTQTLALGATAAAVIVNGLI